MNTHTAIPQSSVAAIMAQDVAPDADRVALALVGDMGRIADHFSGGRADQGYVRTPSAALRQAVLENLLDPGLIAVVKAYDRCQRPDLYEEEDAYGDLDAAVTELLREVE